MSTPDQRKMRYWTPVEHIDAACDLLEVQQARKGGSYIFTPIALTQAQVHVAIAKAKMMGRQRA